MAGLLVTRRKVVDRSQLHGAFSGTPALPVLGELLAELQVLYPFVTDMPKPPD